MQININGLGPVNYYIAEYIPASVSSRYLTNMNTLSTILNKSTLTAADWSALISVLQDFQLMGKNGTQDNTAGSPIYYMSQDMAEALSPIVATLTDAGITIPPPATPPPPASLIQLVQVWQALNTLTNGGITQLINYAQSIVTSPNVAQSLQSMIELDYVKQGNDLLFNNLQSMQTALSALNSILQDLTSIQQISNLVQVVPSGNFAFPPATIGDMSTASINALLTYANQGSIIAPWNTTPDQWYMASTIPEGDRSQYGTGVNYNDAKVILAYMKDWYAGGGGFIFTPPQNGSIGQINFPSLDLSHPPTNQTVFATQTRFAQVINQAINGNPTTFEQYYRVAASAHFTQVFPQVTPGTDLNQTSIDLQQAKTYLQNDINRLGVINPQQSASIVNSLAYLCQQVVNGITKAYTNGVSVGSGLTNWILDNYNQRTGSAASNTAGQNQGTIRLAVQSAQSLNSTQQQKVQDYMFLFQQFYQSASTVLQKVSQMIESQAQNISR